MIAAGAGTLSKAPIESASSSLTRLAALASESGGRIVVCELPLQTDAAHSAIASNQCSWVAHEFVLRGVALVADLPDLVRKPPFERRTARHWTGDQMRDG